MAIPEQFKQDLLNRIDIVDLIERYVPLKKGGANYSACCPFHNEKSPSFTVSPTKQFYHCFGCGAHGNAITFLMEYQGLGYVDAVKALADTAGMKMPEFQPRGPRREEPAPDLYAVMEQAAQFYREQLKASPAAIEYLKGRGLTGRVAARFGIGWAPAGWRALEGAFPDYSAKPLVDCGLVIEGEGGKRYDRFRERVMFPILDQRARVIGFGGRVIGEGEPKYLNSPETPLFEKGRELYGLTQARMAIRSTGRVIVVEGYMDVVALAQHGVENAVATLGTATTPNHLQKLFRQTDEIVFCFDGDAAGRKAAWRALEVALPALADDKTAKFLFLPPEHDPDSFVREEGREAFEQALGRSTPLSAFLIAELAGRGDLATPEGRSRFVHEARPLVAAIAAPVLRLQIAKTVAERAQMALADLEIEMPALNPARRPESTQGARSTTSLPAYPRAGGERGFSPERPGFVPRSDAASRARPPMRSLEMNVARALLAAPSAAAEIPLDLVRDDAPDGRALRELIAFALQSPSTSFYALVLERFRDSEHAAFVERIGQTSMDIELGVDEALAEIRDSRAKLENDQIGREQAAANRAREEGRLSDEEYRQAIWQLAERRKALSNRPFAQEN